MTFYFQSLSLDWLSVGLSPRLGEGWLISHHSCLADDGQKNKPCQACALPRSHTVKEHACQRFQISTPGGTPLVLCLVPPCQHLLKPTCQCDYIYLYNLYTNIVWISLLLPRAKVVTCKAFCQPIGVLMSTRHDGFGIIQWQQPKTGPARSMNFGEVPSGRVFSRTLPPQQIRCRFWQWILDDSNMMRLQLENHSDRPAPYHFVNVDNQKGWEGTITLEPKESVFGTSVSTHQLQLSPSAFEWDLLMSFAFLTFCSWIQRTMLNRCKPSRESQDLFWSVNCTWPEVYSGWTVQWVSFHRILSWSWPSSLDQCRPSTTTRRWLFVGIFSNAERGLTRPFALCCGWEKFWPKS